MVDAGRVDDPRRVVEPVAVQARRGLVQRLVVEGLASARSSKSPPTIGTELIAATGGTRRSRSGAIRPRRAASCERQVVDRGGEDVETCFAISCSVAVMPM